MNEEELQPEMNVEDAKASMGIATNLMEQILPQQALEDGFGLDQQAMMAGVPQEGEEPTSQNEEIPQETEEVVEEAPQEQPEEVEQVEEDQEPEKDLSKDFDEFKGEVKGIIETKFDDLTNTIKDALKD